jgi:uncharacterized protein YjcR
MYSPELTPLGVSEIAKILNVKPDTVSSWQLRHNLPQPDWYINDMKTRIWTLKTIIDWANATGRNKKNLSYENAKKSLLGLEVPASVTSNPIIIDDLGTYDDTNLI